MGLANPAILAALSSMLGGGMKGQQGQPAPPVAPNVPTFSPTPPAPKLNTTYDTGGTQGQLPMPVARPDRQPQPTSGGVQSEMMGKLAPNAAGVYAGLQGVSQVLQQWQSRKDQKESAEAANVAQNLMMALQNNDVAAVHEILNDKHSTRILDKVYKGWLTKAKDSQKAKEAANAPAKPPDPTVSGFENGVAKSMSSGGHPLTNQGGPNVTPPQQQPQQPQQMPRTMGGYMIPQAGPAQLDERSRQNAEIQANKQDPARMLKSRLDSNEMRQAELAKAGLAETPATRAMYEKYKAEIVKAYTSVDTANKSFQKAQIQLQTAQANLANARLRKSAEAARYEEQAKTARENYLKSTVQLDIEKQKYENLKLKGLQQNTPKITVANKVKMQAMDRAEAIVGQYVAQGDKFKKFSDEDKIELMQQLKAAGLNGLAASLPKHFFDDWVYGKTDVASLANALKTSHQQLRDALGVAAAPSGGEADAGGAITVTPEDMAGAGGDETEETTDDSEDEEQQ